jgi:peptidoglycan pentaglycine glycine transferase (the first glycine)
MPEVSLVAWQAFLRERPEAHFLQTGEWGELKSGFGWHARRLIVEGAGVQVLFRRFPLGLTVAYVGKASARLRTPTEQQQFWHELDQLCRSQHAIFCKHEPDYWEDHSTTGLWPRPFRSSPRRTILVDLRGDEASILAHMRQKCRYNIRLAEKKGVTVHPWGDIPAFHRMLIETGERDGFPVHARAYYERAFELFRPVGMCELLVTEHDGRPLSALMIFARGRRAWYVYGGSTGLERERMPNHLLQWEAMRWAKARGCEEYDLWGVPDENPDALEAGFETRAEGLWGVYRFKRGFGGEIRRAVQAVDRIYNPLLYRLYVLRVGAQDTA